MPLEFDIKRASIAPRIGAAAIVAWVVAIPLWALAGQPSRVLRVGLSQDAPMMFRDSAGNPSGFSVDLLREIADRCDWQLEFVDGSWSECIQRLEDGSIDVVGAMVETPARAESIRFCDPPIYVEWGELLLSRRCSGTTMRDLRCARIGLLEGDAHAEAFLRLLNDFGIAIRPHWYSQYGRIVEDIEAGRLDGMVFVSIEGHEHEASPDLKHTGLMFNPSAAKIAFREGIDPEVLAETSQSLRAMQDEENGRPLEALIERYFVSSDAARNRMPQWAVIAFAAGAVGLGLLTACSFLLKRLVALRTRALKHRESQLREAAVMVGVGYWTFDIPTGTFRTNDSLFDRLFEGMLTRDFKLEDYRNIIHPEDAPVVESAWRDFLLGETRQFDVTYRLQIHGRTKYLRSRATADSAGKTAADQVCGVSMDVTPFKESELALRQNEMRLSQSFNDFPVMVAFAMPDGTPLYCNDRWYEKLGYSEEELFELGAAALTHPDDWPRCVAACDSIVSGKKRTVTLRKRYRKADDTYLWADVTFGPIRDPQGNFLHLVVLAVDVTDQRRFEQELRDARDKAEAANRAKSAFLATMSHEIRTPLNAVLGFSNLLAQEKMPPKAAGFVSSIHTAGSALMRVLNDVLDFSKIEADRLKIVPVPTDISTLLGELDAIFRVEARRKGLRFSVENRMCDTRSLMLDAKRLRQVLMNLVGNAVKFTESGRINVTAESSPNSRWPDRREVTIAVSDTGIGIAPEDRERIFEPFEQRQSSNSRRFEGTGLGLAISRRLVEAMRGRLELASRADSGSTFTVRLPRVPVSNHVLQPSQGEASVIPQFVSARVLVVDDVEDNALVLAESLRRLGLAPKTVTSGAAALRQIERNRPDLIMTDLLMPGVSGEEVARAVRKSPACAGIPIIGVTAATDWREWCDLSLFDAVLCKPVDLALLVAALEKVVKRIDRAVSDAAEDSDPLEPAVAAAVEERFAARLRVVEQGAVDFDDVLALVDELHALATAHGSRRLIELSFALAENVEHFEVPKIRRIVQEILTHENKESVDV